MTAAQAKTGVEVERTPMVFQCCGRAVCDGTDCPNKGPWSKVPAWRMDGYYYSFEATGSAAIDRILSAVGCAGKAYHHTEDWNDEAGTRDQLRGNTPIEWIQNAAIDATAALAAERAEAVRMREENEKLRADLFPLQEFMDSIFGEFPDHGDIDGFDLQDIAEACGLLKTEATVTPCGEHCGCAENGIADGTETQCYRVQPVMRRARIAVAKARAALSPSQGEKS